MQTVLCFLRQLFNILDKFRLLNDTLMTPNGDL